MARYKSADEAARASWKGLIRTGAAGAFLVLLIMPVQAAVFLISPPPATTEGFFQLFQDSPLLGLVSLDLLLTLDYLAMIPFYLALFAVIRQASPAWALLALAVGLTSVVLFVVSREATFSMWILSDQFVAAGSDSERASLLAAGTTLLTVYDGSTFAISYLLGAASTLIYASAMLRHRVFGKLPGMIGLLTGLTMLIPANAGTVGLVTAMLSLIPTAWWLILLIPRLLRTASELDNGAELGHF